ncbi:MAG: glycosyltransferase family 2 protein [Acidobacteriota bacterium]
MRTAPAVTVVIVNWNGRHLLELHLPSVLQQSFRDFELIVVDNGSTDGSQEFLRKLPDVQAIELAGNAGFGPANNAAFVRAAGSWIATVNNDITLDPNWLSCLVEEIEKDPHCFAVQGKNLQEQNPGMIDGCGLGLRACGAARRLFRNRPAESVVDAAPIFAASSGAAVYRRSMLEELGLFDPTYFAYYEDLDVGWRARLKGWHSTLMPQAVAYHKVHGTSDAFDPGLLWFLSERNRLRTFVKNLPVRAALTCPARIVLDELRYLNAIRAKAPARALLRARHVVVGELRSLWAKRMPALKRRSAREWLSWIALGAGW